MPQQTLESLMEKASQAFETGDYILAIRLFEEAYQISPSNAEIEHFFALIEVQKKNLPESERWLQQAILHDPENPHYYNHLGNILRGQQKIEDAIKAHQHAILLAPDYAEAYNNLGNAYYRKGDLEEAKKYYQDAIAHRSDYWGAWYNLALIYQKQNDLEESIRCFQMILNEESNVPDVHFQIATLYQRQSCFEKAITHYQQVIDRRPNFIEAHYNLGLIYLEQQQYNLADFYLQHAAELETNSPILQYNLGVIATRKGQIERALTHYERALELEPSMIDAHHNIANLYAECKNVEKALYHYDEVLKARPEQISVRYMRDALVSHDVIKTAPPEYIQGLFDQYATYYDEHLKNTLHYQAPKIIFDTLKPWLSTHAPLNILDLGCGTGQCGIYFKPYATYLCGIDLSPKMLEIANKLNVYDQLTHADLSLGLTQQTKHYDLICAADVFIYVGELATIFSQINAVLKHNGYFVFTVEESHDQAISLQPTARFAHGRDYLEALIHKENWDILQTQSVQLRKHQDTWIEGLLWVCRRR